MKHPRRKPEGVRLFVLADGSIPHRGRGPSGWRRTTVREGLERVGDPLFVGGGSGRVATRPYILAHLDHDQLFA